MRNLADKVHALSYALPTLFGNHREFELAGLSLREKIRTAKRFTLDNDFLKLAVYRATKEPARVAALLPFAAVPFQRVFIEYDWYTRTSTQFALGAMGSEEVPKENRAVGYLIERHGDDHLTWKAYKFIETLPTDEQAFGVKTPPASPMACVYMYSAHGQSGIDRMMGQTRSEAKPGDAILSLLWGYNAEKFREHRMEKDVAALKLLEQTTDAAIDPFFISPMLTMNRASWKDAMKMVSEDVQLNKGDIRFIITMLAMINVVPVSYKHVPATGSYKRRLKNIPYMDHSVVKIEAGRRKIIRVVEEAFRHAERARHRAHNVRGFFRTYHKGTPDEYRVWIKEHVRGDATLGWVRQEWEVTAP